MGGHIEKALSVARQLPTLEPRQDLGKSFEAPDYAWAAIGEAIARSGDLAGAYRHVVRNGASVSVVSLFDAYREGLAERGAPGR
jgi:hypothetical protein